MENPFVPADNTYKRDLNIHTACQMDVAKYIQLQTNQPLELCLDFVKRKMKSDGGFELKNPESLVLVKDKNGDRTPQCVGFLNYLNSVVKNDLLLTPSLTTYLQPSIVESTHARFIAEGVANRAKAKKEMFIAEQNQNHELVAIKDGIQNNLKTNNNSYSGATVSTATILYCKSTHSSLTSTCRTATSYANATNEKFIAGNRHYYTPEITKANIVSIINNTDLTKVAEAIEHHGLHYPTAEQTLECIQYSTNPYWQSNEHLDKIKTLINNMSPVERAAVVYVGDLYHLHKYNGEWVVGFLFELSTVVVNDTTVDDNEFNTYHNDVRMLANFLCFEEVAGRSKEKLLECDPSSYYKVKNTARNVYHVMHKYEKIINAFWLTKNLPPSIHAISDMYRKAAVVSDTDSTMFTLQHWVKVCFGKNAFTAEAKRVVFSIVFLVSEIISHILAIFSANMGVKPDKIHLLEMKNEYYFAVLSMTTRSKHYFASQDAREGLVFTKPKMEIKGVGLRDSKVPKQINDGAKKLMEFIIETIKDGRTLSIRSILRDIGDIERNIITSIDNGSPEYMLSAQIKPLNSYKNENNATYAQYKLWQEVFAPSLGATKEPPYAVVKVSLMVSNKTEVEQWCHLMNNPSLAARLMDWSFRNRKYDFSTLLVPSTVVETTGIPKEIIPVVDKRKIISNTMASYYLILESLGVFMQDKNITRLVSDSH